MNKGIFITLEGPDGSGKTTHSRLLFEYLKKRNYPVIHTREPGGTLFTEYLRKMILDPKLTILPLTELLLYSASRAQHTEELLVPSLKKGKIIVCERYNDATVAYQGFGRKLDLLLIEQLNRISTGGLEPDLTVLLDIPAAKGMGRVTRNKKKDRLENEAIAFHNSVRKGYLYLAKKYPERIKLISTEGSLEDTHRMVVETVESFIKKAKRAQIR